MRIVSGLHKGRPIIAPKGRATRPTGDRAREAVFNVLAHAAWAPSLDGARVLDLFAGSGALGLEALSRGAAFCLFVETDSAARGAIRSNVDAMQLFGASKIHRRSATSLGDLPHGSGSAYDMAFMDPPYGKGLVEQALASVSDGGWLAPGGVVMAETGSDEDLAVPDWEVLDTRTYGAACVRFLRQAA